MTHELGPLPRAAYLHSDPPAHYKDEWVVTPMYTSDQLRAYALAEVQKAAKAERERCAQIVAGTKFRDGQLDARRGPDGVGTWHERSPMGVTMRALVRAILGDGT